MFDPDKKYLVTQSNYLIDAKHSSTLQELRIVLTMIGMVQPQDENFKEYKIKIKDLSQLIGVKGQSMYEVVKETLDKLMKRTIYIPNENGFLLVHWVSSIEYHEGEGVVSLCFDPKLKPYLLNLKGNFTTKQLEILLTLSTPYSVRIYQLLKKNEGIGKVKFDIDKFKEILGIENHKYRVFQDLKRWVINSAKKDFETRYKETGEYKSDITFDLETIKEKRKTKYLVFHIRKQQYQPSLPLDIEQSDDLVFPEIIQRLIGYGISQSDAKKFINEQGEEQIERCLCLFEDKVKNGVIKKSLSGYLVKMLREKAGVLSLYEKEQREKADIKKLKNQKKTETKKQIQELKDEFNLFQKEKIEKIIKEMSSKEKDLVREEFEKNGMNSNFEKQQYKKSGLRSALVKASYRLFLRKKFLSENEIDFVLWANEKGYKIELVPGTNDEYKLY